jgi:hypothetical protein
VFDCQCCQLWSLSLCHWRSPLPVNINRERLSLIAD